MGTIARRFAVMVALVAVVGVGCAKDETVTASSTTTPVTASSGGGSGTTEPEQGTDPGENGDDEDKGSGEYAEACSIIQQIDDLDQSGDMDQAADLFAQAKAASPEELADHWDTLADVFDQMAGLSDEEAAKVAFDQLDDPQFLEAAKAIDDFAQDECGLDIGLDPTEEDLGGLTESTDTTLSDPAEDPTSITNVKAFLEGNHGDEAWWPVLDDATSWESSGGSRDVTWTITLSSSSETDALPASELVAACEAMAGFLDTYETRDVTIEIDGSAGDPIVSRAAGEACEQA